MKKANFTLFSNFWGCLLAGVLFLAAGQTVSAQCSYVCDDLINVPLDEDCIVPITPEMVIEGVNACPGGNLVVEMRLNNGPWQPAIVTSAQINQTWQVRVRATNFNNYYCWGYMHIEDKLAPEIQCTDIYLNCAVENYSPAYLDNVLNIADAYPFVDDNCSPYTLTHIDTWFDLPCGLYQGQDLSAYVRRVWTAVDASGNTSTCTQYIYFRRLHVGNVLFPPDVTVDCEDPQTDPSSTGVPYYTEFGVNFPLWPDVAHCEFNVTFSDQLLEICDGTHKILRTWTVYDWCLPTTPFPPTTNPFHYIQLIKIEDASGPYVDCPEDITVSTNPGNCLGYVDLPNVLIRDNCSRINSIEAQWTNFETGQGFSMLGTLTGFPGNNLWDLDTLGVFGVINNLPLGTTEMTYIVTDDCGKSSTCVFDITVQDLAPPFPACQQSTTVAIGGDDPLDCYEPADGCSGAGITWVPATSFDSGSYDNCGNVHLTIYRMDPYSDCIEGLNHENGHPDCSDGIQDVPSEYDIALGYERNAPYSFVPDIKNDSIKFYCCEAGTTQMVVLRVYQTDYDGNIQFGPDGPIYNECMIEVQVQDKVKPACTAPANVTVWCENFDPSLWAYGNAQPYDNCCLDTAAIHTYQNQCGLTHSANYTRFDTLCNRGTITRTWRAWDCHGESGTTCTQQIFVNYRQDYFVKFPADVIVTTCDGTGNYGEPTFLNEDCELMAVSMEEDIFTVVPDACFKIERTWTVTNWCTYNGNLNPLCVDVPNPNPNPISNHVDNLPGVTISANGTLSPWNPTVRDVFPNQGGTTAPTTNYSVFYHGGVVEYAPGQTAVVPPIGQVNCFRYKQIIKVIDTQAPEVVGGCPASPVEFCDLTPNNVYLWNESYWWDNVTMQHDLCEGPTDLCITATDACSGANINIDYLLFLDLDGDGVMETVLNSVNTGVGPNKYGYDNVPYGNYLDPNFGLGTPREFDNRLNASGTAQLPLNQRYGFTIQRVIDGNNLRACVRWNTIAAQTSYVIPELPYGTHKIKWIISDGCGNQRVCEYTFIVRDCKPPTVVCYNGLSVNIMPTGMITVWATDFLQYAEDNCTPTAKLKYGIVKSAESTGTFPGTAAASVTFTCDELGTQPVQLWAQDLGNPANAAYCETYLIVQDPFSNCGGSSNPNAANVAGAAKVNFTDPNMGVEGVNVNLSGTPPNGLPSVSTFSTTGNSGVYFFNAIPVAGNYSVSPLKDDNPMNGVSTFDLVLMSKHILGITPLSSPYKIIAADINKNGSVTTFDIVELRKLILGIYTDLPANTSWRFVQKDFNFSTPENPFADNWPEMYQIADLQTGGFNAGDFVSIKVGDLNGDVTANATQGAQERTGGTLFFDVADRVVRAGEEFDVTVRTAEKTAGYQFTLNLDGLQTTSIAEGEQVNAGNFGVFDHQLTASIDGAREFTVRFRAEKAGKLSEMLQLGSQVTVAEAYTENGERYDVAFRFNGANGQVLTGAGFELLQNTPNPVSQTTNISFNLPEAAEATLTLTNAEGRVVKTMQGQFAKGLNTITLQRADLEAGILFYQVSTPTHSAVKKMIVIE